MKNTPIFLFGSVLLGCLSAAATTLLMTERGSSARGAEQTLAPRPSAGDDGALARRVEELVQENRELQMRLANLEDRPAGQSRAPIEGYVSVHEFQAFQKEIRALHQTTPLDAEPEELKEQVAGLLIDIRKEEAVSKVRDYQEKREARLDEDVQKISDWLELNSYQTQEMRTALSEQYERENEVRLRWEAGEDDEVLGELKRSGREEFGQDLQAFLTPEQTQTFWERVGGGKGQ